MLNLPAQIPDTEVLACVQEALVEHEASISSLSAEERVALAQLCKKFIITSQRNRRANALKALTYVTLVFLDARLKPELPDTERSTSGAPASQTEAAFIVRCWHCECCVVA